MRRISVTGRHLPLYALRTLSADRNLMNDAGTKGVTTVMTKSVRTTSPWLALLGFFILSYAVAALGGLSTASSVKGWYAEINKPSWTPPNVVFGPVWTILYGLIAWSGWRFWKSHASNTRTSTLRLFAMQMVLNALWSPVFFGAQQYLAGAVVIVALALSIAALIAVGRRVDAVAAWTLVPYLLWVLYASTLNIGIFILNP